MSSRDDNLNRETKLYQYTLQAVPAAQSKEWDQFINDQPNGHLLQSWGWGELKASGGWHPVRLALRDEHQQMVAAAQVLCRTPAHLPLWAGHLAYIPKGPVVNWSQSVLCKALFSQLNAHLYRQGALALRLEPNEVAENTVDQVPSGFSGIEDTLAGPYHDSLQFHPARPIQPLRTILLDLTADENTLLARMKEKWRYNLRLAERKGVTVRVAQTLDDVQSWYVLLQATGGRDQFGIHTQDYYLRAWQIFAPRNQARLFLAEYNGQLLAGIFVSLLGKQAIYLYGASSNEHRNLMPNHLLQWEAIRWAKQEGATHYDFWGIAATDDENDPLAGVYRFKRGWGGEIVRFVGCYERVYRPLAMSVVKRFLPL